MGCNRCVLPSTYIGQVVMEILEDNPFTQMKGHQEVKKMLCQQHFAPSSQDSGVLPGCMIPGAKDLLLVSSRQWVQICL